MNTTTTPSTNDDPRTSGFLGSKDIGGFGYGIGVSVAILLLITSITLASYFCTRSPPPPRHHHHRRRGAHPEDDGQPSDDVAAVVVEIGLDEETIKSYPKLHYVPPPAGDDDDDVAGKTTTSTARCCSICLADYKAADSLRKLPECGHLFHARCVDPWLRLHPTCPVCRTSPAPTPLSTPLAEVVPLATRRD